MKIFVASFNRASDGAISKLVDKLKKEDMHTHDIKGANYVLAVGDRTETFDFILEQYRKNKKIIHLWAGEISQGTHDELYRHAMTLMSDIQLCTNDTAKNRVIALCKAVDKKPNAHVVGNVMMDNLEVDESLVPDEPYDLILYNPATKLTKRQIKEEIKYIDAIKRKNFVWIEPNGDIGSELLEKYITTKTLPRPQFLGLLKNCTSFITNSSCMYYEAPFFLKPHQIHSIGERNTFRESKHSNMRIPNASDNIIKIIKEL